jgi:hypothetical protein
MSYIKIPRARLVGAGLICLDLGLGWRHLTLIKLLPVWYTVGPFLWVYTVTFAVSTYIFMVAISLIGRRFSVTRWFLNPSPPAAEGATNESLSESASPSEGV